MQYRQRLKEKLKKGSEDETRRQIKHPSRGRDFKRLARRWAIGLLFFVSMGCEVQGPPEWPEGKQWKETEVEGATSLPAPEAACRPMYSGEAVINEVILRPAGRDIDGDGLSNTHDELIEIVNLADQAVHLGGAELWWGDKQRGIIENNACIPPDHAVLIVGSHTGMFKPPSGAHILPLNKTLRLSDGGGTLRLVGLAGGVLDEVVLPPATDAKRGCVARRADGTRGAPLMPHQDLIQAKGASMSPGLCSDGRRFPTCVP